MAEYKIIESVGNAREPVTNYADLEHHHPGDRLREEGRVYARINGSEEEIAGDYNGTAIYTNGGQLMVSKDFILLNKDLPTGTYEEYQLAKKVDVPSPANGYIGNIDRRNGLVEILDQPGGEVMFRIRHMDIKTDLESGDYVKYGESLGQQSGFGNGSATRFPVHVHIDINMRYLSQADRYLQDMHNGTITTDRRPETITNVIDSEPIIEPIRGNFPLSNFNALANKLLEPGESGEAVKALQEALNRNGYDLPTTGNYRTMTEAAVRDYQTKNGLGVDGKAWPETLEALGLGALINGEQKAEAPATPHGQRAEAQAVESQTAAAATTPTTAPVAAGITAESMLEHGAKGDDVRELQRQLRDLGYQGDNGKPLPVSGYFGDHTDFALRNFQRDHEIEIDGKAGPETRRELDAALQNKAEQEKPQSRAEAPSSSKALASDDWFNAAMAAINRGDWGEAERITRNKLANPPSETSAKTAEVPTATSIVTPQVTTTPLSLTIADPQHPQHFLYQQADKALADKAAHLSLEERSRSVATIAASAADAQFKKIDSVQLIDNGAEKNWMATDQLVPNTPPWRVFVEAETARHQPLDVSTQTAEKAAQEQAERLQQQTQWQSFSGPRM